MKTILITITFITCFSIAKAQVADTSKRAGTDTTVYLSVDQDPSPQDGTQGFKQFLMRNIRYPAVAYEQHKQGKVLLTFVIEKDGSLTHIRVAKKVSKEIDAEALRVMAKCPNWTPATKNGQPVRCQYTIPVYFALEGNTGSVK